LKIESWELKVGKLFTAEPDSQSATGARDRAIANFHFSVFNSQFSFCEAAARLPFNSKSKI